MNFIQASLYIKSQDSFCFASTHRFHFGNYFKYSRDLFEAKCAILQKRQFVVYSYPLKQYSPQSPAQDLESYFAIHLFICLKFRLIPVTAYSIAQVIRIYYYFISLFPISTIICFPRAFIFIDSKEYCSLQEFVFRTHSLL